MQNLEILLVSGPFLAPTVLFATDVAIANCGTFLSSLQLIKHIVCLFSQLQF